MTSQNSVQPSCSQGVCDLRLLDNLRHVGPVVGPGITPGGGVTVSCPPDRQAHNDQSHQQGPGAPAVCCRLSRGRLFATPWTVACQAPLPMGFSRQDYWGGWPCPPPGDVPDPASDGTHFTCIGRRVLGSLPLAPPGSSWRLRVKGSESALKGRNGSPGLSVLPGFPCCLRDSVRHFLRLWAGITSHFFRLSASPSPPAQPSHFLALAPWSMMGFSA